jgi:hypothetical protein
MFLDHFDTLILKIKNSILIYFWINNILKNNYYYIFKHPLTQHKKPCSIIKKDKSKKVQK